MKLLLFMFLGTSLLAQTHAPVIQHGGDCTINTSGSENKVSLVCNKLDPKLAEQVRAILNRTNQNEKTTKEISDKLDQILKQVNKDIVPPVVGLRFVYPESPSLVVVNQSDSIARDIKWIVALWNMDLPDRNSPLPIPESTFDWLRPKDEGGPENLFDAATVASLVKPGDRLFGTASVICPECGRGRTYVVYIIMGKGGWVSEIESEKSGRVLVPKNGLKEGRERFFKDLEAAIPVAARVPIGGLY